MFLSSLLSTYAVEKFEPVALWMTVGVLGALLLAGVVLFFAKRSAFGTFLKIALWGAFLYLSAVAVLFFALDLAKNYSDSYAQKNWLDKKLLIKLVLTPLLVLSGICLLGGTASAVLCKRFPEKKRLVFTVFLGALFCALCAVVICLAVYYEKKIANDGYYNSDVATVHELSLYLFALLAIAAIVLLAFTDKQKLSFDARALAYAGVCVSMSFALSYIKLWDMPAGGSVTLVSLLPVMLYSVMFGAKKGVAVGFTYGVLQAVQDPWLIHPAQFLLDYPVAFSAAGLAGVLKNAKLLPQIKFTLGALVAGTMRFVCHVLSGALAFEAYAEGQNPWIYSLVYNTYVFVDIALVIAAGILLFSSKAFCKQVQKAQ